MRLSRHSEVATTTRIVRRGLAMTMMMIALLLLAGCTNTAAKGPSEDFTVAAASDMQPALERIANKYDPRREHITLIFGSSGLLARQIEQGAPVDLFVSANKDYVDQLRRPGLVKNDPEALARGAIVLVGKSDPNNVDYIPDLGSLLMSSKGKIAIANPAHAPYGKAARQALDAARLWKKVEPRVVYGESASQTWQLFQSGQVESAIVALSQARQYRAPYYLIDRSSYDPITQWAAVVGKDTGNPAAEDFLRFMRGKDGSKVLQQYGYRVVNDD